MYLSQLELLGFKSFAQKTKLKFNDGIACVIGPNGSGKSNIVDSIRWVLGEQKVTSLRTDKMESVIFNGSKNRKPLSLAEVSLTIHNNRNVLASEYTDVVISRRLYRDGESQYFINQSPCRLKDINSLFMDTGMGSNSYSVIELGMVESIISENASERRHLFEEAAGVTKYKNHRKSALRKLESTQQDMSRIEDIITEITRNVNSLSRQVGKARRYLKFQEELKYAELELARFRFAIYNDAVTPLRTALEEISLIKEDATQQITLEEAILEEYKRELIQSEHQINHYGKILHDLDERLHQIKEEKAIALTRTASLGDSIRRNVDDISGYNTKIKLFSEQQVTNRESLSNATEEFEQLNKEYLEKEKESLAFQDMLKDKKSGLDTLNTDYKIQLNKVHTQKEATQQKKYQQAWNQEQIQIFKSEKEALLDSQRQLNENLTKILAHQEKLRLDQDDFSQKVSRLEAERATGKKNADGLDERINKLINQRESLESQLAFYEEIITSYQGHSESTRTLMKNREQFPEIHGPISDVVSIDEDFALALEVALGDAINYLIVDDVTGAQRILRQVEENKLGRVTIIPLERVNKLKINSGSLTDKKTLADLMTCKPEYKNIFQLLVGDAVVVDSLDQAIAVSEKNPGLRYVTKSGEIVTNVQAITGGQKKDIKSALIGRKEQIEKIKKSIRRLEEDIDQCGDEKDTALELITALSKEIDQHLEKVTGLNENQIKLGRDETEIRVQIKNNETLIEKRKSGQEETFSLLATLEEEVKSSDTLLNEMSEKLKTLETKIEVLSKTHSDELSAAQLKDTLVKDLNVKLINAKNIKSNIASDIQRTDSDIAGLQELVEKRTSEISNMEREITEIKVTSEKREKDQLEILEERDKHEDEKSKIELAYHEVKDKIINLENQIRKFRKQHDSSLERTRQLELDIKENEMKAEAIRERIKDEYNEDISIGIPFDGLNVEESEQNIETLKYKINQMGQVNPLAVSEYERESERLEFFNKQFEDLKDAEKLLLTTIDKINVTARKHFTDTFESIKINFEKVFGSFFQNGEGTLKMEETTDPLEANIEILVRPKGKRMQTINLLSGGEKTLTAISLLFSIYLVKPSPFCILDEIDAPLDDVNIGRFTQALKDFSKDTQFIVVTHNKRTMEAASTLYGVTMEEEGLSKIVSVKFN